ncbi:MAG: hypothetical protein EA398_09415 [Deltaproteobacteria bacterium]|nr:MAG: hypothetical protein EA398_09415 [Deltaproteobacteria bacterium]
MTARMCGGQIRAHDTPALRFPDPRTTLRPRFINIVRTTRTTRTRSVSSRREMILPRAGVPVRVRGISNLARLRGGLARIDRAPPQPCPEHQRPHHRGPRPSALAMS